MIQAISGDCFTGMWKNGKKHGHGKFIEGEGKLQEGEWVENKFQKAPPSGPLADAGKKSRPVSEKSQVLGANLSSYETNLYEYSSFSLNEEIDIVYCKIENESDFLATTFDDDTLHDKVSILMEMMEQ